MTDTVTYHHSKLIHNSHFYINIGTDFKTVKHLRRGLPELQSLSAIKTALGGQLSFECGWQRPLRKP